ncbi:MAG: hypothetical protein ACI8RD_007088, partial [Bacillariaceae sp.]
PQPHLLLFYLNLFVDLLYWNEGNIIITTIISKLFAVPNKSLCIIIDHNFRERKKKNFAEM